MVLFLTLFRANEKKLIIMPTNQRALVACILDRKFLLSLLKWRIIATYPVKIFRIVLAIILTYQPHFIHNATFLSCIVKFY